MNYKKEYQTARDKFFAWLSWQEKKVQNTARTYQIFPEEEKSDEDRIRDAIRELVYDTPNDKLSEYSVSKEEALTWLNQRKQTDSPPIVKPQFEIGNWIVHQGTGKVYQVTESDLNNYCLTDTDGNSLIGSICNVDKNARLWSIEDAMPGDIIVVPPIKGLKGFETDEQIFIFKGIKDRDYVKNAVEFYCRWYEDRLYTDTYACMGTSKEGGFLPATKLQRDRLMKGIADAGYTWDAKNKELNTTPSLLHSVENNQIKS